MARTDTKTLADPRSTTTLTRARCNTSASCRCGQQLDLNVRAHCPRCGRSLTRP